MNMQFILNQIAATALEYSERRVGDSPNLMCVVGGGLSRGGPASTLPSARCLGIHYDIIH